MRTSLRGPCEDHVERMECKSLPSGQGLSGDGYSSTVRLKEEFRTISPDPRLHFQMRPCVGCGSLSVVQNCIEGCIKILSSFLAEPPKTRSSRSLTICLCVSRSANRGRKICGLLASSRSSNPFSHMICTSLRAVVCPTGDPRSASSVRRIWRTVLGPSRHRILRMASSALVGFGK